MSSFGENYKKNDLLDNIQHFFSEGGTIEEMFDVLRYIFEYGKTPLDDLIQENQELKKQLKNCYCNRTDCSARIKDSKKYDSLVQKIENQQKEFIEYMEDKLSMCDSILDTIKSDLEEVSYVGRASGKTYIATQIMKNETARKCYEEMLKKYKEIIGGNNE